MSKGENTFHDSNHVAVLAAMSSSNDGAIVLPWADPVTHRLLTTGTGISKGAWYNVTGTIDGSNATFTIPVTPSGDIILVLDGQVQMQGVWYTISGTTITYQVGYIPTGVPTNLHQAYIFTSSLSSTFTETPSGLINSSNVTYTTLNTITTVIIFSINGEILYQTTDYTVSGNTITFVTALDSSLSGKPFVITYLS